MPESSRSASGVGCHRAPLRSNSSAITYVWGMVVSDESKGGAPKKLSTKDILAAARAQAAQAAGGDAPAASVPAEPAAPAPSAEKPAAERPAAKSPAKPAGGKKPTSTADIHKRIHYGCCSANAAVGDPAEIGLQCVAKPS